MQLPPVPPVPDTPPLPAQTVEGTQALIPLGWPLTTRSSQQPVVQSPFELQSGEQVPAPVPNPTQKALEGKPQQSPFTLQGRLFAAQVPPAPVSSPPAPDEPPFGEPLTPDTPPPPARTQIPLSHVHPFKHSDDDVQEVAPGSCVQTLCLQVWPFLQSPSVLQVCALL